MNGVNEVRGGRDATRADASICTTAVRRLRSRAETLDRDERRVYSATGSLLDALCLVLARDPESVPEPVHRAVLGLAHELDYGSTPLPANSSWLQGPGTASGRNARKGRATPFTESIRLGRMG